MLVRAEGEVMRASIVAGLGLVLLGTAAASAHHSLAPYNRSTYKTVEGTVKDFSWSKIGRAHV